MPGNPFYRSRFWLSLRAQRLKLDKHRCAVPGCPDRATHVDHIETRPRSAEPTPADRIENLRSLCATHDGQAKEMRDGRRRNAGQFTVKGCDAAGWPRDPRHRR